MDICKETGKLHMNQDRKKEDGQRILCCLFFIFFVIGILLTVIWKNIVKEPFDILSQETLSGLSRMEWNCTTLLVQCMFKRGIVVLVLPAISMTAFGTFAARLYTSWFSFSMGALMEILTLEYGLPGLLLFGIGIFPQYLFYIPAYIVLLGLCVDLNQRSRQRQQMQNSNLKTRLIFLIRICMILGVVIIGTIFESYVNPRILRFFSNLFF